MCSESGEIRGYVLADAPEKGNADLGAQREELEKLNQRKQVRHLLVLNQQLVSCAS